MSMRWNCNNDGCFLKVGTPDWGFLDNAFSGKIRVGDIDGIVEANGHLLIIEWKGVGVPVTVGQEIMFNNGTRKNNLTVFVVNGDAEHSIAKRVKVYKDGKLVLDEDCDNAKLSRFCTHWETTARKEFSI